MRWSKFLLLVWLAFVVMSCGRLGVPGENDREKEEVLSIAVELEIDAVLRTEEQMIDGQLKVLDLSTDDHLPLSRLLRSGLLYFYFENLHCSVCVTHELHLLKQYYAEDQVIILIKHQSVREAKIFMQLEEAEFPTYLLAPQDRLGLAIATLHRPFYFRIRTDGSLFSLYSPKFSYPELSERYHRVMSSIL